MYVGVLTLRLYLHGVRDLKAKRRIVQSVRERVRSRFNCAVAEVDDLDRWQSAVLGVSVVSNDGAHADSSLQHIADFVDGLGLAEVLDRSVEILVVREE